MNTIYSDLLARFSRTSRHSDQQAQKRSYFDQKAMCNSPKYHIRVSKIYAWACDKRDDSQARVWYTTEDPGHNNNAITAL